MRQLEFSTEWNIEPSDAPSVGINRVDHDAGAGVFWATGPLGFLIDLDTSPGLKESATLRQALPLSSTASVKALLKATLLLNVLPTKPSYKSKPRAFR